MRKTLKTLLLLSIFAVVVAVIYNSNNFGNKKNLLSSEKEADSDSVPLQENGELSGKSILKENIPGISVIAEDMDTPWAITFLPEGGMLVTERMGSVRFVTKQGILEEKPVAVINEVNEVGEGGLMGIAVHPDFKINNYVYLYYTYSSEGDDTLNRVIRTVYQNGNMSDQKIIIDAIPGASNHDGGRIKFGPDKLLYITTGDAQEPSLAQDKNSLAGKILRVKDDGTPAEGNPFGNRTYSYGHRNSQGITWDNSGKMFATEHGPSGFETGNDEFNEIIVGGNFGWPEIRGKQTKEGMIVPIIESGRGIAWAPAGLAYVEGKFYFAGLRGSALYEFDPITKNFKEHFKREFGRLRDVVTGPDGMLYVTSSNKDGRGAPKPGDDKLIRINPRKL